MGERERRGERLSAHWTEGRPGPLAQQGYDNWIEEQIAGAISRGDFDNLPGRGRPLDLGPCELDRDWLVHHILANAHVVPEWVELEKQIRAGLRWLKEHPGSPDRARRVAALNGLIARFNLQAPILDMQFPFLPADF